MTNELMAPTHRRTREEWIRRHRIHRTRVPLPEKGNYTHRQQMEILVQQTSKHSNEQDNFGVLLLSALQAFHLRGDGAIYSGLAT